MSTSSPPLPTAHRPTLTRPLDLIAGRAYAAVWPALQPQTDQTSNPSPSPSPAAGLLVLRDDGLAFGPGGDHPFAALGLDPLLPFIPPAGRLWSPLGLAAFRGGHRPAPASVFQRLADTLDHFTDFERSLGPQRLMAELTAASVLVTWLAGAFSSLGLLWLTGDHPAAVRLLHLLARLSFLGVVAPAGVLSADLRALAGYGATLAFDDPADAAGSHPGSSAWRAWLLTGAHRGAAAFHRQYDRANHGWRLFTVSTFCPRLFASAYLPEARLAPDIILLPLVRTARARHAAPLLTDPLAWPHDPAALQDDLWALSLAALPALPAFELRAAQTARLEPGALSPWLPILAVALWLSENGLPALFDRLHTLALDYQSERLDLLPDDFTALVIRAIADRVSAFSAFSTINGGESPAWPLSTQDIISAAQLLHTPESSVPRASLTPHRVGRLLTRLRLPRAPRPRRPHQPRLWHITRRDLERLSNAYGLSLPSLPPDP